MKSKSLLKEAVERKKSNIDKSFSACPVSSNMRKTDHTTWWQVEVMYPWCLYSLLEEVSLFFGFQKESQHKMCKKNGQKTVLFNQLPIVKRYIKLFFSFHILLLRGFLFKFNCILQFCECLRSNFTSSFFAA